MKKNIPTKKQKGFTLVEAMVTIAIVGLLATFFLINFRASQQKARDNKRIADIQVVIDALELYRDKYGYYPGPGAENPNHRVQNSGEVIGAGGFIDTALSEFIRIPTDPFYVSDPATYYYSYDPDHMKDGGGSTTVVGAHTFELLADDRQTSSGGDQGLDTASYNRELSESGKQ